MLCYAMLCFVVFYVLYAWNSLTWKYYKIYDNIYLSRVKSQEIRFMPRQISIELAICPLLRRWYSHGANKSGRGGGPKKQPRGRLRPSFPLPAFMWSHDANTLNHAHFPASSYLIWCNQWAMKSANLNENAHKMDAFPFNLLFTNSN